MGWMSSTEKPDRRTPRLFCCCTVIPPALTCSATSSPLWPISTESSRRITSASAVPPPPSVEEFDYTFDALAKVTASLLDTLGVTNYTVYVHDYGAPIAWRLALRDPDSIEGVISQNGNAYEEGFVPEFWEPIWAYANDPSASNERALRPALEREAIHWQYTHGVPDVTTVSPDAWELDIALMARPGVDRAQLALFADYASNRPLYPKVHQWLRTNEVPVLAVWGKNDEIFGPAGATAFLRHAPNARIELIDGGHFVLESHLDEVVEIIHDWRSNLANAT